MSKTIPKYRPYLSEAALLRIMDLIPVDSKDKIDKEIHEQVGIILARNNLSSGGKPAYIATPRPTLVEKLGINDSELESEFKQLKKDLGVPDA